ncbi:hypothetical protein Enr10x_00490 [Gimesia panareensis]|uniref:Uncharacterized protein n=1 Tax=Gimesia panareensis TaxID=2527978 RepID=A0A517PZF1_9PLAN|nr:hypothetical protein Enr10x_00490 [Gimesia panareensis]
MTGRGSQCLLKFINVIYWIEGIGIHDAPKIRTAGKTLRRLRAAFYLAKEMGSRLGGSQVLQHTLPS